MNIIVTGGSRGIGEAIVRRLARAENNIVFTYLKSEERAKNIQNELTGYGLNVEIYKANLASEDEATNLIKYVVEKYGKVDVLINNVGITSKKLLDQISLDEWNNIIQTNLNSVFYTSREVSKNMIHNKDGVILNISSVYGINGGSIESAYSASKAGIIGFTKSLAKELGPSNIRVNAIAPGAILTDMNNELSEEEKVEIASEIPLNRWGEPNDVADVVEMVIKCKYINGETIVVDGGWSL